MNSKSVPGRGLDSSLVRLSPRVENLLSTRLSEPDSCGRVIMMLMRFAGAKISSDLLMQMKRVLREEMQATSLRSEFATASAAIAVLAHAVTLAEGQTRERKEAH